MFNGWEEMEPLRGPLACHQGFADTSYKYAADVCDHSH
jgi:hypothetical protein